MRENVTILIPTFNASELLSSNIPIFLEAAIDNDEVLIIDDASSDDTVSTLIDKYGLKLEKIEKPPVFSQEKYFIGNETLEGTYYTNFSTVKSKRIKITLFKNASNVRFAAAANIGFLLAKHQLVFLCNNDVTPESNTIAELYKTFVIGSVFGVGCLEYENTKSGEKSGKNKLWFERGLFQHSKAADMNRGETAWVSGGSGLFDRKKWVSLGGFDKRFYPAYWEDIDISFRARKAGYQLFFEPNAVVIHKHETTNSNVFGSKNIEKISFRNSLKFSWKNTNNLQKFVFLFWLPYWLIKCRHLL